MLWFRPVLIFSLQSLVLHRGGIAVAQEADAEVTSGIPPVSPLPLSGSGVGTAGGRTTQVVNIGCVQDWNANANVAPGNANVWGSLEACKTQCAEIADCIVGLYVTEGPRAGECWLADEKLLAPVECGAPCLAFEKVEVKPKGRAGLTVPLGSLGADCDWNVNGDVAPGSLNFQPSAEACQAQCASLPHCTVGLYVTGGVRRGECWLSSRIRDAPVHCQTACFPFRRPQADDFGSGVRGTWEPCRAQGRQGSAEGASNAKSRVCLRLEGATMRADATEETVLEIHDLL